MNKTFSIGLAGYSFIIEEHAYVKLGDYLAALRNSLDADEADEVMHDIEIRMVEIFRESLGKREVINDSDVEKVVAQIGKPEQIEQQEEAYYSEKTAKKTQNLTGSMQKQLFRDPENAKLGGVCAGLANYFGITPQIMRVIWATVAILGIFSAHISTLLLILIYIVLWAVLPKAQTAADFLKMKGKPMNFDNLKLESNKIVQFANESTQKVGEMYNESKPFINDAGNGIWNVFRYILGIICGFIALGSILGIFVIFGLFGNPDFPGVNNFNFLFSEHGLNHTLTAMMVIGALIPAIIFSLLSIKLISPKTRLNNIGYVIGGLFLALIGLATYFGINMAQRNFIYKGDKEETENVMINTQSDTLYLDKKQITIPQSFTAFDDDIFSDKKSVFEGNYPNVDVVRKPEVKSPYLTIKKEGRGYNVPLEMKVPIEIQDNKIFFPNFINYPYQHRFRDYHVNYELVVPQNFTILQVRKDQLNLNDGANEKSDQNDATDSASVGRTITINTGQDSIIINGNGKSTTAKDKDNALRIKIEKEKAKLEKQEQKLK